MVRTATQVSHNRSAKIMSKILHSSILLRRTDYQRMLLRQTGEAARGDNLSMLCLQSWVSSCSQLYFQVKSVEGSEKLRDGLVHIISVSTGSCRHQYTVETISILSVFQNVQIFIYWWDLYFTFWSLFPIYSYISSAGFAEKQINDYAFSTKICRFFLNSYFYS